MRFDFSRVSIAAAILVFTALPIRSQVVPSATEGGIPLVVGAGFSNFDIDYGGDHRMNGGTLWLNWTLTRIPNKLQGLGLDIEARDISCDVPAGLNRFRYDTAEGGVIYHKFVFKGFHPYAKGLIGFGSIDFPGGTYTHDTRSLWAMGGGADLPVFRQVAVRVDYEYQVWQRLFAGSPLRPNGVTVGVEYNIRHPGR